MDPIEGPVEAWAEEPSVRQRLDQERRMVRGAIAMVGARGVRSVTVGGLRFGEEVGRGLAAEAAAAAVTLVRLSRPSDHGCDLKVVPARSETVGPSVTTPASARLAAALGRG
jgi:hypothetical protein